MLCSIFKLVYNDLIANNNNFFILQRDDTIFILNEFRTFAVVKCRNSLFSGRSLTGGVKKNISFFWQEMLEHHIESWRSSSSKNAFENKFLCYLIDFFLYYGAENNFLQN